MDLNTLVFGGITILSLGVFFFFGRYRASAKQRDRDDRINWSRNRFNFLKYVLIGMAAILAIAILIRLLF